jgi:hypothetical protein
MDVASDEAIVESSEAKVEGDETKVASDDAIVESREAKVEGDEAKVEGNEASNSAAHSKRLRPYDFKAGILDNDNVSVIKIYAKLQEFVVYRTENAIRIDIDDDHKKAEVCGKNHHKIAVDLARIYSLLPEKLSKTESINRLIGRAITTNAAGNYDSARSILAQAEERLTRLKVLQGRLQYTVCALLFVFVVFVLTVVLSLVFGQEKMLLLNVALYGALGGVMSISIGFSSLEIDIDASPVVNCLVGWSRILIAIVASIFAYFAIKADVAFSFVSTAPANSGLFMIAMVSGFVEMLVPNLMNNLTKDGSRVEMPVAGKVDNSTKPAGSEGVVARRSRSINQRAGRSRLGGAVRKVGGSATAATKPMSQS